MQGRVYRLRIRSSCSEKINKLSNHNPAVPFGRQSCNAPIQCILHRADHKRRWDDYNGFSFNSSLLRLQRDSQNKEDSSIKSCGWEEEDHKYIYPCHDWNNDGECQGNGCRHIGERKWGFGHSNEDGKNRLKELQDGKYKSYSSHKLRLPACRA